VTENLLSVIESQLPIIAVQFLLTAFAIPVTALKSFLSGKLLEVR
jgi:hypothetical protein